MPLANDPTAPATTPPRETANFNPFANITAGRVSDLSQQQLANAAIIVQVGRQLGVTARDMQIALITAMVESNLINVDYGDRDSLGLFQQRPSQGWGTPAQVMDPEYAARKFYTTLLDLGDRRFGMGMGEAAQAVQRSAYPERYAERIPSMRSMWPQVMQLAGEKQLKVDGSPYFVDNALTDLAEELDTAQTGSLSGQSFSVVTPEPLTPSAQQLLGAWGMSNPTVQQPDPVKVPDPYYGAGPIISPATNSSVITQLAEETGDFQKGVDGWRKAAIAAARSALGTPYVWGGNSLQGGVDCSGLVQQALAAAGIQVPRVSYQQANFGTRVGIDALRPGDLVAWDNSSRNNGADHIALYIGNGQIIEAARPGTVVRIRSVSGDEGAWGVRINR